MVNFEIRSGPKGHLNKTFPIVQLTRSKTLCEKEKLLETNVLFFFHIYLQNSPSKEP